MCDGHAWMDIHMIGYCLELAKQHHKLSAIAQTHATIQKSIVLNKRQSFSEYDGYIIVFMSCVSSSGCRGSDASPPSAGESGRMRRRAYSPPELHWYCLHAYYPATEPFEYWENLTKEKYNDLKELRSQNLWKAVEKVIPDIRKRAEISMVGTPLTHASYLRRYKGSYGAAYKAGEQVFPFGSTPVKSLLACGDFVFPGIGLPTVRSTIHVL